jgi:uncharacterized cupin superfamily protein
MSAAISFRDPAPNATIDHPRPDRLISGNPCRQTWLRHEDPKLGFYCGEWACEVGAWRIEYGARESELFTVVSGQIRICDNEGNARDYGPGDTCVIPCGFAGSFEVLEPCRKIFAIIDRN